MTSRYLHTPAVRHACEVRKALQYLHDVFESFDWHTGSVTVASRGAANGALEPGLILSLLPFLLLLLPPALRAILTDSMRARVAIGSH